MAKETIPNCLATSSGEPLVCATQEIHPIVRKWLEADYRRTQKALAQEAGISERILSRIATTDNKKQSKIVSLSAADALLVSINEHYSLLTGEVRVFRNPFMGIKKFEEKMLERGCDEWFIESQETFPSDFLN